MSESLAGYVCIISEAALGTPGLILDAYRVGN